MQAFEWHQPFREGRESIEDNKCSGRPQTYRTAENIERISEAVRKNRLQTMAESVGVSSATYQQILTKDLNMHKTCQHIVPCMLNNQSTDEVKVYCMPKWLKMDYRNGKMCVVAQGSYFKGGCVSAV
ncbi:uncharacterized protein TNCV_569441 [Trichonephila clavipes]|nr:uncharacterized protein TNCV_569441 [Trichonephila clavipes]